MRRPCQLALAVLLASAAFGLSKAAHAQSAPPPARTGFQMSFRMGFMVPVGDASGAPGDALHQRYSDQFGMLLGLGAKVSEAIYVGTYFGGSFGTNGGDTRVDRACTDRDDNLQNDISCGSGTLRAGLELEYHFQPAARVDPWLGYGIGPEFATQSITDHVRAVDETTSVTGWEYARLAGGINFRLARAVGLAPTLEGSLGQFNTSRTELNSVKVHDAAIPDRALHGWITVGLRLILFP